ncbi:MAG: hypothetical protein CM15mL6_160 [uncultured marine virus]|nr:MAG: hypothetical protein CM15mL6_160 [uncultured marine virus]
MGIGLIFDGAAIIGGGKKLGQRQIINVIEYREQTTTAGTNTSRRY